MSHPVLCLYPSATIMLITFFFGPWSWYCIRMFIINNQHFCIKFLMLIVSILTKMNTYTYELTIKSIKAIHKLKEIFLITLTTINLEHTYWILIYFTTDEHLASLALLVYAKRTLFEVSLRHGPSSHSLHK